MAKLTSKERNKLPSSKFSGPDRSYPVNDKNHARNALARVSQQENKGKISSSAASKIRAKADKVISKKK